MIIKFLIQIFWNDFTAWGGGRKKQSGDGVTSLPGKIQKSQFSRTCWKHYGKTVVNEGMMVMMGHDAYGDWLDRFGFTASSESMASLW